MRRGELETQIEVALRQKSVMPEAARAILGRVEEVGKMLNGLLDSLEGGGRASVRPYLLLSTY